MEHTQGKWESVKTHKRDEYDIWAGDEGVFIATTRSVPTAVHEPGEYSKQANANLISNAPEMLFCLQELQFNLLSEDASGNSLAKEMSTHQMKRLAETIAKAEGK